MAKMISITNRRLAAVFENIGREPGLEKILRAFYKNMASDLMLEHFFMDKDVEQIALMQKQFLMRAMGATPSYAGKPPADAHTKIPNILRGHFDRRLVILRQTLTEFKVSAEDIETWIQFENAFRKGIEVEEGSNY